MSRAAEQGAASKAGPDKKPVRPERLPPLAGGSPNDLARARLSPTPPPEGEPVDIASRGASGHSAAPAGGWPKDKT